MSFCDLGLVDDPRKKKNSLPVVLTQVQPTTPKLMSSFTKSFSFSIDFSMAYGVAGLGDGDDLVYFCGGGGAERHRRIEPMHRVFAKKLLFQ